MVAISRVWYDGSYTIAAKPIKTLELHYTMIQFLIIPNIHLYSLTSGWALDNRILYFLLVQGTEISRWKYQNNYCGYGFCYT